MAGLGEKMRPYDFLQKARHQLDEFRGKRLGIFAHPLDQYLELFDAVYMSIKNGNKRIHTLWEALLPFVQTYSSALQRARRDKFHWQRLAMVFHPVEPDVIGLLVLTKNAIMRSGLKQYDLLEGLPVSREASEILSYLLHNIGRAPNVKTQIWIAVSVYVLVAIVKKKLRLNDMSLYTILQILSVSLFEKDPLLQILTDSGYRNITQSYSNQLKLFDY